MKKTNEQRGREASLALALASAVLSACGAGEETYEDGGGEPVVLADELASLEQAVVGGQAVTQNVAPFSSVVSVFSQQQGNTFSAVKIGPGKYLCAAHSLMSISPGTQLDIHNSLTSINGLDRTMTAKFIHPSYAATGTTVFHEDAYDVGVFTTAENDFPTSPDVDGNTLGVGTSVVFVGYGNTSKHRGDQVTAAPVNESAALSTRYIITRNNPNSEVGDSGGPLFTDLSNPNGARIRGVVSGGNSTTTFFTRVSNTELWIANPHNLQTNIIANNATGFLQNRFERRCIGISGNPLVAGIFECDGRNQPDDNQYYRMVSVSGTSFFQIQSRRSFNPQQCLQSSTSSTSVNPAACSTSTNQHWTLQFNPGGAVRIKPRNVAGECLRPSSTGSLIRSACNSGETRQDWHFYR